MPHSPARLRTRLTARWASSCGPRGRLALDVAGPPRATVLEDDAGHAHRVQPRRDFLALELPVEVPVAASRTDHHRRSRVLFPGGLVDRQGRLGDVGDQLGRSDQRRLMNPAGFLALDANVSRHLPRPEVDDQRLGRESRNGRAQGDAQRHGKREAAHDCGLLWKLAARLVVRESFSIGRRSASAQLAEPPAVTRP